MVDIRKMTLTDIPAVASIHRSILREATGVETGRETEGEFRGLLEAYPDGCIVAEVAGEVVGFIIGTHKHWGFGLTFSGWIEVVGVHPDHMGRGIGKALGMAVLEHFKEQGITDIRTSVRWDSGDLITFFKSVGFDKSDFINLRFTKEE